eukprot:gene15184-biopygen7409
MPTKLAKGEGTFASQIIRNLQPAAHAKVAASSGPGDGAQAQGCARRDQQRGVHRYRFIIQAQHNVCTRHRHHRRTIEAQQRPAHGDFQRSGALGIAQQAIAQAQRATVHRPRRRHAYGPVTEAPRIVLHTGLRAGAEHFKRVGVVHQIFKAARPRMATGERCSEQNLAQIIAVGFHAVQLAVAQGLMQIQACLFAGRRPGDELGDHRVEVGRNLATGLHPRVDAQAFSDREVHIRQKPRAWLKLPARIFGVQACLNRVAVRLQLQFPQWRHFPGGQLHHPAHQVHAPHLLGDAMFHLQPGVHFQKIEAAIGAIKDKFHGAGAAVIHCLGQGDGGTAQLIRHAVGQVRRRGFFKHFLVAPLHRTVAHAEGDDLAAAVTKHLHFQVPGVLDVLLDKHTGIAEIVLAQAFHRLETVAQFIGAVAHAHADPATTGGAFKHDRIAHGFPGQ